jgi:methylthioribose-1-phosphate isomerase
MQVNGKNYRTVWMKGQSVFMIEQRLLPHTFKVVELKSLDSVCDAISTMVVRGAGAIGASGAFGLALGVLNDDSLDLSEFKKNILIYYKKLVETRPTANDLKHGLDFVMARITDCNDILKIKNLAYIAACEYADTGSENCRKIGEHGAKLIKDGYKILTHCNAGWLAFVDFGSALSPVYTASRSGKKVFVYVDETRPRLQGANLTSFELSGENIPHSIIADNAAGFFMQKGSVNMVITGADRIAVNGDAANKIGTYEKAVLAFENGIPFYIAAPSSTIDLECESGKFIPIEKRDSSEVTQVYGRLKDGSFGSVLVAPSGSNAENPAFDVTPARYITGIITEKGVIKANRKSILENFGK